MQYPVEWTNGKFIPGAYVLCAGQTDFTISTGWETSINIGFERDDPVPHVAQKSYEPFPVGKRKMSTKMAKVTPQELKTYKTFIIAGEYVHPYEKQPNKRKKTAKVTTTIAKKKAK
jgi:hypothetical protein